MTWKPETDDDRLTAFHEAGHAVEANLGGPSDHYTSLGVHHARLRPSPLVRSATQERLESRGLKTANPPLPLDTELVRFYEADIRVRMAGPLAQFMFRCGPSSLERKGGAERIDLRLWGGDSDADVISYTIPILQTVHQFDAEEYLRVIKNDVWRDTLARAGNIQIVAEALLESGTLTGPQIEELLLPPPLPKD